MSFRKVLIFTCNLNISNDCTKEIPKEKESGYGGPPGFLYYFNKQNGEIEHGCPECINLLISENKAEFDKNDKKKLNIKQ